MTRALAVVATLFALSSCSGGSALLPDGGRPRYECFTDPTVVGVHVKDAMGAPVAGATVTGLNKASGKSVTGTTDGNGNSNAITEDLGQGEIQITATSGSKTSVVFAVQLVCGTCDCVATPPVAPLTVQ